jgi:hypothetical protein
VAVRLGRAVDDLAGAPDRDGARRQVGAERAEAFGARNGVPGELVRSARSMHGFARVAD